VSTSTRTLVTLFLALAIGATAGSLITRALVERDATTSPVATASWDAQKLAAMEGRVLAAQLPQAIAWDANKLAAMEGRVLAEQVPQAIAWDADKLAAMEGRLLAEQVGG
jgi:hypothetical protein